MATSNIERFDRLTGVIFAKLYSAFPIRIDLDLVDLMSASLEELGENEFLEEVGSEPDFVSATMDWLEEAGYIVKVDSTLDGGKYLRCTLTHKALEALKAVPEGLGGPTLGSKIADASKSGALKVLGDLASQTLGVAVGMAAASLK